MKRTIVLITIISLLAVVLTGCGHTSQDAFSNQSVSSLSLVEPSSVIESPVMSETVEYSSVPQVVSVDEVMVWIPRTGSKYHRNPGCSGMNDPTQVTKSKAERLGYDPCQKCY